MDFKNMFCKEEDHTRDRVFGAVAGITAGLGIMYLFDPTMGRRRRSTIMEGVSGATHKAGEGVSAAWHRTAETVSDAAQRVAEGAKGIAESATESAKGIAEKATSMFSGDSHGGRGDEMTDEPWSPTTRMLVGTAGGALVAYGMTQRFPVACALGTVGLGLVARAVTNFEIEEYLGMGGGREESMNVIRPEESRIPPPHMGRPPAMTATSERRTSQMPTADAGRSTHRVNSR